MARRSCVLRKRPARFLRCPPNGSSDPRVRKEVCFLGVPAQMWASPGADVGASRRPRIHLSSRARPHRCTVLFAFRAFAVSSFLCGRSAELQPTLTTHPHPARVAASRAEGHVEQPCGLDRQHRMLRAACCMLHGTIFHGQHLHVLRCTLLIYVAR